MDHLPWIGVGAVALWLALCWFKVIPEPYAKWSLFICGGFTVVLFKMITGKQGEVDHKATAAKINELSAPLPEVDVPDLVGPTPENAAKTDAVMAEIEKDVTALIDREAALEAELAAVGKKNKKKRKFSDTIAADPVTDPNEPDDDVVAFINGTNKDKPNA